MVLCNVIRPDDVFEMTIELSRNFVAVSEYIIHYSVMFVNGLMSPLTGVSTALFVPHEYHQSTI